MLMLGAKYFKSSAINILLCDYESSSRKKNMHDRNISERVPSAITFHQETSFVFFLPTKPFLLFKVILNVKPEGRHKGISISSLFLLFQGHNFTP